MRVGDGLIDGVERVNADEPVERQIAGPVMLDQLGQENIWVVLTI